LPMLRGLSVLNPFDPADLRALKELLG